MNRLTIDAPPHPRHPLWGQVRLPGWVSEFRQHQWDCAREIVRYMEDGVPLVFLDGPTGAGKTLIAEMVRRLLGVRATYICSGKTLQDQFVGDFDNAHVLKGRGNYPTLFGDEWTTCEDCTAEGPTDMCLTGCYDQTESCPYTVAKLTAGSSDLAVLNTAYFLAEASVERTVFGNKAFGLGVFDEADTLESEIMGHVEVVISSRRMAELKVGLPEHVTKPEAWEAWIREKVIPAVRAQVARFPKRTKNIRQLRAGRAWARLLKKLYVLAAGVGSGNWIFDGYRDGGAVFKPVRIDTFGQKLVWRHFPRYLLMSATLISADEMVESLGYDGEYRLVQAPMTFPVENRKVIVAPVANMTNKEKEAEWPKAARAISEILRLEGQQRVLVHTVSYALAQYLIENVNDGTNRPFYTYRNAKERDEILALFRNTPGSVIFAPSLERGVDLKNDDCRVCIVAKMAFPNLGDKQINARLHSKGGQLWYAVQTVRSLVQSTGRGVRHADDFCTTYIIDRQFVSNVWKKNKFLLPRWWVDAVDMSFNANKLRG